MCAIWVDWTKVATYRVLEKVQKNNHKTKIKIILPVGIGEIEFRQRSNEIRKKTLQQKWQEERIVLERRKCYRFIIWSFLNCCSFSLIVIEWGVQQGSCLAFQAQFSDTTRKRCVARTCECVLGQPDWMVAGTQLLIYGNFNNAYFNAKEKVY